MEDKRLEKRKEFLNPVKDGRQKREKFMVDLRKKRKQQMFRSKRMIRIKEETKDNASGTYLSTIKGLVMYQNNESSPLVKYQDYLKSIIPIIYQEDVELSKKLDQVKVCLEKDNYEVDTYIGLVAYIRFVSCKDDESNKIETITKILKADLFPLLMKYASIEKYPEMTLEISWLLTNITSKDDKQISEYVLASEFNTLEFLRKGISHDNLKIAEHCIWALTNLLEDRADNEASFVQVFELGLIDAVVDIANRDRLPLGMARVLAWCISNICMCRTRTKEFISIMIDTTNSLLFVGDDEAAFDCVYAYKHLTEVEEKDEELEKDKMIMIEESNIIHKLMSLLDPKSRIFAVVLRLLGNLASSSVTTKLDKQIVQEGFFEKGSDIWGQNIELQSRKEILWIVSNLVSAKFETALEFYNSPFLIPLLEYLASSPMNTACKEGVWVLSNLVEFSDTETRISMVKSKKFIEILSELLKNLKNNPKMQKMLLLSLDKLLETEKYFNENDDVCPTFVLQQCGGLDTVEELHKVPNSEIFSLSQRIITKHFPHGEEQGKKIYPSRFNLDLDMQAERTEPDLEF